MTSSGSGGLIPYTELDLIFRLQVLKLYYVSLEAILTGERQTSEQALQVLTSALKFHKGVMACCLEVVIASYK